MITSAAWQVRNILKTPRKPIRFDEPWGTTAAAALTSDVSAIRSAALSHAVPVKHVRCGPAAPPRFEGLTSHSGSYELRAFDGRGGVRRAALSATEGLCAADRASR